MMLALTLTINAAQKLPTTGGGGTVDRITDDNVTRVTDDGTTRTTDG